MGRSEADYKMRVDVLWAYMSRHGLPACPDALLDEALSDEADWTYLA